MPMKIVIQLHLLKEKSNRNAIFTKQTRNVYKIKFENQEKKYLSQFLSVRKIEFRHSG